MQEFMQLPWKSGSNPGLSVLVYQWDKAGQVIYCLDAIYIYKQTIDPS